MEFKKFILEPWNIILTSLMIAFCIGGVYILSHIGGGNVTIPDYFKTEVFDPDQSTVHEVIKYIDDIFNYWIVKGIYLACISAAVIGLLMTLLSIFFKRNVKKINS